MCDAQTFCPEGWFCATSGACQKFPRDVNCQNFAKNGGESDVDCGGPLCEPCVADKGCAEPGDCASVVCTANICQMPSCTDGVRNGNEPGLDCGGGCPSACPNGSACGGDPDCQSLVCVGGLCQVPACTDGVKNGSEGDLDCGLVCPTLCTVGDTCGAGGDCTSAVCAGTCQTPACNDLTKNADETDVDCGGSCVAKCDTSQGCAIPADCTSGVCTGGAGGVCVAPGCTDLVQNGGESDVDCGGSTGCLRCATNRTCTVGTDCVSVSCPAGICVAPSCTDNVQNGTETDVDCGGGCPGCRLGQGCTFPIDCQSHLCTASLCDLPLTIQVATGGVHTCALLSTGEVRCWGAGFDGRLGYGNTNSIGDNETPASAGSVNVGGSVIRIAAGGSHTCALLSTGEVRCWGDGSLGRLGYGNINNIGDNETPASAGSVNVGGSVSQVAAGFEHTCALLTTGEVRCWGLGDSGQLGYGNLGNIGDNETPATAGSVNVGGGVAQIAAGGAHTCAVLTTAAVRCWGLGSFGQLGYGNTNNILTPATAGGVNVGGSVSQITAGDVHTCALLTTGDARCWGNSFWGQLGYGNTNNIGDNETPATAGSVNVGGSANQIAAGDRHNCVLLNAGEVRCWGQGLYGQLGYGNPNNIGDNETPASAGSVILAK